MPKVKLNKEQQDKLAKSGKSPDELRGQIKEYEQKTGNTIAVEKEPVEQPTGISKQDQQSAKALTEQTGLKDVQVDESGVITSEGQVVDPKTVKVDPALVGQESPDVPGDDLEKVREEILPEKGPSEPSAEEPKDGTTVVPPTAEETPQEGAVEEQIPPTDEKVGEETKEEVVKEKSQAEMNAEATGIPFTMRGDTPVFDPDTVEQALQVYQLGGSFQQKNGTTAKAEHLFNKIKGVRSQSPSTLAGELVNGSMSKALLNKIQDTSPELYAQVMSLYEEKMKTVAANEDSKTVYNLARRVEGNITPEKEEKESDLILKEADKLFSQDDYKKIRKEIYDNNPAMKEAYDKLVQAESKIETIDFDMLNLYEKMRDKYPNESRAERMARVNLMSGELQEERFLALLEHKEARADYNFYKEEADAEFKFYQDQRGEAINWALKKYDINKADEIRAEDFMREDAKFTRDLMVQDAMYNRDVERQDFVSARERKQKIEDLMYEKTLNHAFWTDQSNIGHKQQLEVLSKKHGFDKELERIRNTHDQNMQKIKNTGSSDSNLGHGFSSTDGVSALSIWGNLGLEEPKNGTKIGDMGIITGINGSSAWRYGLDIDGNNDFTSKAQTPLGGTVTKIIDDQNSSTTGFGNQVEITTENGEKILLSHLDSIHVREGDFIGAGESVGFIGNTGNVLDAKGMKILDRSGGKGSHLDVTMKDANGNYVEPSDIAKIYQTAQYASGKAKGMASLGNRVNNFLSTTLTTKNVREAALSVAKNSINRGDFPGLRADIESAILPTMRQHKEIEGAKAIIDLSQEFMVLIEEYEALGGDLNKITGSVEEMIRGVTGTTADPRLTEIAVRLADYQDMKIRERTGAVVTEGERKFYDKLVATTKVDKEVAFAQLRATIKNQDTLYVSQVKEKIRDGLNNDDAFFLLYPPEQENGSVLETDMDKYGDVVGHYQGNDGNWYYERNVDQENDIVRLQGMGTSRSQTENILRQYNHNPQDYSDWLDYVYSDSFNPQSAVHYLQLTR